MKNSLWSYTSLTKYINVKINFTNLNIVLSLSLILLQIERKLCPLFTVVRGFRVFFDIFAPLAQYSRYMRHKDNALLRPVGVSECISVVIASCQHILDEQK